MTQNITALSTQEAEFLSRMAAEGREIFSTAEAQAYWTTPAYTANVLSRLVRKGWLQRLDHGLYMLIPLAAGPERTWTESGLVIASYLIRPAAVAYWSALHYWGLSEQVPRVVFVQSTRRKRPVEILGMRFRFVTMQESRFFGVVRRSVNGAPIRVTDREKTLLDAAARPDLSGGVALLAGALRTACQDINWPQLDDYLERWGGGAVVKRLGFLLDTLALPVPDLKARLERWQGMLSQGIAYLEPGAGRTGRIATRWRVRVNVAVDRVGDRG